MHRYIKKESCLQNQCALLIYHVDIAYTLAYKYEIFQIVSNNLILNCPVLLHCVMSPMVGRPVCLPIYSGNHLYYHTSLMNRIYIYL